MNSENLGLSPSKTPKKAVLRSPFGEYLRQKRLQLGVTVDYFASLCWLNHCTITYYETGRTHPRRHVCDRIAKQLGLDKEELWQRCQDSRAAFGDARKREVGPRKGCITVKISVTVPLEIYEWLDSQKGDGPMAAVHLRKLKGLYQNEKQAGGKK